MGKQTGQSVNSDTRTMSTSATATGDRMSKCFKTRPHPSCFGHLTPYIVALALGGPFWRLVK